MPSGWDGPLEGRGKKKILKKATPEIAKAAEAVEKRPEPKKEPVSPAAPNLFSDEISLFYAETLIVDKYNAFVHEAKQGKVLLSISVHYAEIELLLKSVKKARERSEIANTYYQQVVELKNKVEDLEHQLVVVKGYLNEEDEGSV